jgi:hypothetical protein
MNTFKTIGVAIMLSLSLLLSGVACVLIAVSMKQHQPAGDADVVVAGIGNSGNNFGAPSHRRLVKEVMERGVAPPVGDDLLRTTVDALLERAKRGDTDAAAFVFELAAAQRAKQAGQAATPLTNPH